MAACDAARAAILPGDASCCRCSRVPESRVVRKRARRVRRRRLRTFGFSASSELNPPLRFARPARQQLQKEHTRPRFCCCHLSLCWFSRLSQAGQTIGTPWAGPRPSATSPLWTWAMKVLRYTVRGLRSECPQSTCHHLMLGAPSTTLPVESSDGDDISRSLQSRVPPTTPVLSRAGCGPAPEVPLTTNPQSSAARRPKNPAELSRLRNCSVIVYRPSGLSDYVHRRRLPSLFVDAGF